MWFLKWLQCFIGNKEYSKSLKFGKTVSQSSIDLNAHWPCPFPSNFPRIWFWSRGRILPPTTPSILWEEMRQVHIWWHTSYMNIIALLDFTVNITKMIPLTDRIWLEYFTAGTLLVSTVSMYFFTSVMVIIISLTAAHNKYFSYVRSTVDA